MDSFKENPEMLERLADLNLSTEEITRYRRKFNAIDLNKDGKITLREMFTISRVFGYKFTLNELKEIFGQTEANHPDGITFDKFVRAMIERTEYNKRLSVEKAKFHLFDPKRTGSVTSDGAYPFLKKWLGFDVNKTESLIDMYDFNKDYKLTMKEFIPFYTRVEELKTEVEAAFRQYDRRGSGFVEYADAKEILMQKGYREQQIYDYFKLHDLNSDGKLDYSEFTTFYNVPIF